MKMTTLEFAKTLNPNFVRAWECSGCDACGSFWSIFGQTEHDKGYPDKDGYLSGGFACPHCGFTNAGKCHKSLISYPDDEDEDDVKYFQPSSYPECSYCHACGDGGVALNDDCLCAQCFEDES